MSSSGTGVDQPEGPFPGPSLLAAAREAVAGIARPTPLLPAPILSECCGGDVFCKCENLQVTGSFKVRGAATRMLALTDSERRRGVVTCSSGNHGRATAYVAQRLGIPAVICVPEWVDPVKLTAMRSHGARMEIEGATYDEAEAHSFEIASAEGLVYVHPFDDPRVIAGQGTIGLELYDDMPGLDTAVVPLSGGGLISGIGLTLKGADPSIRIIGVSAERARVMHESVQAGRPLEMTEEETIASALSGGIGTRNRHTLRLVTELVDEYVLVSEAEIAVAMRTVATELKLVVEGGGAVAVAALLAGKLELPGQRVAVVVSGGNVDPALYTSILNSASRS